MASRGFWLNLFEEQGWLDAKGSLIKEEVAEAGIAFGGVKDKFLGLIYVVEMTEDFLVFEYEYEASDFFFPWQQEHTSGETKMWLPWSEIDYVWQNKEPS
jgi:hypothetical protein